MKIRRWPGVPRSVGRVTAGVAVVGAAVLAIGGPMPAMAAEPTFTVTDLGSIPGFAGSEAFGINNQGVIYGIALQAGTAAVRAVRWDKQGNISELPVRPGDTFSLGGGITAGGTIVGEAGAVAGFGDAVQWNPDGSVTTLAALPGYAHSNANEISENHVIVGVAFNGANSYTAARWNRDGTVTNLGGLPGGTTSQATSVNIKGVVVGFAQAGDGQTHAVRWSRDGAISDLGIMPGYVASTATVITDSGTIIGWEKNAAGQFVAVRWNCDGSITTLGTVPGLPPTYQASGINRHGTIIGVAGSVAGNSTTAIEWSRNGSATALPPLSSITFDTAFGINDAGDIVGTGRAASGFLQAVVWRPTHPHL